MLESRDPSLQYLAYRQRLDSFIVQQILNGEEVVHLPGLNPRTVEEIKGEIDGEKKHVEDLSTYSKTMIGIGLATRHLMLKSIGQKGLSHAYVSKPLQMMNAYDPPIE